MWTTPKTDWSTQDYFSAGDYNRIIRNLEHLKGMAEALAYVVAPWTDLGEDVGQTDYPYAPMINAIEDNLEQLAQDTYAINIGAKQQFVSLGPFITAEELNRIESAQLTLCWMLLSQQDCRHRLAFRLGGQKGVRV